MTVLAIEDTTFDNDSINVTAVVDNMLLLYRATYEDPEEWAPALCSVSFRLDPEEQIPTDEDAFCQYLDSLDLTWQPIDYSDWDL